MHAGLSFVQITGTTHQGTVPPDLNVRQVFQASPKILQRVGLG